MGNAEEGALLNGTARIGLGFTIASLLLITIVLMCDVFVILCHGRSGSDAAINVWFVIATQTALLAFLQFGDKILPSNFAARKSCHAGSGLLMLTLNSNDPVARCFVYFVVFTSLCLTWRLVPSWAPRFRFGELYDAGITIYLLIVAVWFALRQPVHALAPLFVADPAGAVIGKLCTSRGFNMIWWENKTVMGTLAVFVFSFASLSVPLVGVRIFVALLCAIAEAFGGQTFDNAVIALPAIASWVYYHPWR
eukprot:TRINITY_DN49420_c0_g1_i1.p1 TRINITY_DN49420_c0_g1~~TRINITY_DN49420_c0_g1_i1.p1  ORF type:complete len:251 (-),score=29.71 TRINITY_DN49420_c0_g1_i1:238-990(-)